jgi:hypothetical protein
MLGITTTAPVENHRYKKTTRRETSVTEIASEAVRGGRHGRHAHKDVYLLDGGCNSSFVEIICGNALRVLR